MSKEQLARNVDVLLIGSGIIGSVYAAQLALSGQPTWVYEHSEHDRDIAINGIKTHDVESQDVEIAKVELAKSPSERSYDLVLVAVSSDQLDSTFPILNMLKGSPHIIVLGNNPDGYSRIPNELPGTIELGFPGIGGSRRDEIVEYVHIPQQPTTLEAKPSQVSSRFEEVLKSRGFQIQRTSNIDGWLAYHSVLISSIAMALIRSGIDASKLGNDRLLLKLMCQSIEEGYAILKNKGTKGLPSNLAVLHQPILRPFAERYWGRTMRSSMGELCFAAHSRHASDEMQALARWVVQQAAHSRAPHKHLDSLLSQ